MRNKVILLMLCLSLALFSLTVCGDVNAYDPKFDWLKDYTDKEKAEEYADDMSEQDEESFKLLLEFWMDYAEELLGDEELTEEEKAQAQGLVMLLRALADKTSGNLKGKLLAMANNLEAEIKKQEFVEALLAYIEEISGDKLTEEEMEKVKEAAEAIVDCGFGGDCDTAFTEEEEQGVIQLLIIVSDDVQWTDKMEDFELLLSELLTKMNKELAGVSKDKAPKQYFIANILDTIRVIMEKHKEKVVEFLKKYGGYGLGKWGKVYIAGYPTAAPKQPDYLPWWRLKLLEDIASGGKKDEEEEAGQEGEEGKGSREYGLDQLKELRRTGKEIKHIGGMIAQGRPINEIEDAWETFVRQNIDMDFAAAINGVLDEYNKHGQVPSYTEIEQEQGEQESGVSDEYNKLGEVSSYTEHAGGTHIIVIIKTLYDKVVAITGREPSIDWSRLQVRPGTPPIAVERQKLPAIQTPRAVEGLRPPAVQRPPAIERPKAVQRPPATERPPAVQRPPAARPPAERPAERPSTPETSDRPSRR